MLQFLFSQINPLDMLPVEQVKSCEIIDEWVHFQIPNDTGGFKLKKVKKTQFIMSQIAQFSIPIEANI